MGYLRARQRIIAMDVDVIDLCRSVDLVQQFSQANEGHYVCVSNVHMCMEVMDSDAFQQVVNQADLVVPDGKPLSWAQKLLGHSQASQVRGQDLMNELCRSGAEKKLKIGLYGGSSELLLADVKSALLALYPNLDISYAYSPPFRALTAEEDAQVVDQINAAGVDVLFVGIGCPKQERWMAEHKARLGCVMLGVGAAFDFIAGEKKHAPRWIQAIGLEWLFRLCSEPKRLWKRYLKQNPRFVWYFLQQWLFGRKFS